MDKNGLLTAIFMLYKVVENLNYLLNIAKNCIRIWQY